MITAMENGYNDCTASSLPSLLFIEMQWSMTALLNESMFIE